MRRLGLGFLAALCGAAAAQAAPPVRLITATADPGFDRHATTQVAVISERQRGDVGFNVIASRLGDAMTAAGLNVQQDAADPEVLVLFEYKAVAIPTFRIFPITDPAYRAAVVTAIDGRAWREGKVVKVLWQTAFDQTGISNDEAKVMPPMLAQATRWYGRNLTAKGLGPAARCGADTVSTGSHIPGACITHDTPAALLGALR